MARKGQFKKGGGRHGDGGTTRSRSKGRKSTAIVVVPTAVPVRRRASSPVRHHVAHHVPQRKGKRRHHHSGVTLGKVAGTAIVLANVAGSNSGPLGATVYDWVQKIPGAKTFGGTAVAGAALGLLSKTRLGRGKAGPWLKAAGLVGVIAAAIKVGEAGTSFKWLGDVEDGVMRVQR